MAFNSSLSVQQVTFKPEDARCGQQRIESADSLVNFTGDMPAVGRAADSASSVNVKQRFTTVQFEEIVLASNISQPNSCLNRSIYKPEKQNFHSKSNRSLWYMYKPRSLSCWFSALTLSCPLCRLSKTTI